MSSSKSLIVRPKRPSRRAGADHRSARPALQRLTVGARGSQIFRGCRVTGIAWRPRAPRLGADCGAAGLSLGLWDRTPIKNHSSEAVLMVKDELLTHSITP